MAPYKFISKGWEPSLRFHIVSEDAPSAIVRRAVRILRLGYNLEFHRFAFSFFLSLSLSLSLSLAFIFASASSLRLPKISTKFQIQPWIVQRRYFGYFVKLNTNYCWNKVLGDLLRQMGRRREREREREGERKLERFDRNYQLVFRNFPKRWQFSSIILDLSLSSTSYRRCRQLADLLIFGTLPAPIDS